MQFSFALLDSHHRDINKLFEIELDLCGRAKTTIYTNTHKRLLSKTIYLLNSFNHMFNHRALEPRCGALRPGALQLGGAQTGYREHRGKTYAHALTSALPACTCAFRCPN